MGLSAPNAAGGGMPAAGKPKLAIVVSHPIQHFAPLYREVARCVELELRVFFCCDWGVRGYFDPGFGREVQWDVPLLDGYEHEFLPIRRRPSRISFLGVDNPAVGSRLTAFGPDVVLVHGYGCRTMWRAAAWARARGVRTLLSSDSSAVARVAPWKRPLKRAVVGAFYHRIDGAIAIGDNNAAYHRSWGLPQERIFRGVLPADGARLLRDPEQRAAARAEIRDRLSVPADGMLALFCGNLVPWKRPIDFVRGVVLGATEGAAVWGVVVGDGPLRGAVDEEARRIGGSRVTLAGFVNQSEISRYYAAADVLVVTSDRDAHPLVVTEALFFGLPVVLSEAVGCIGAGDTARPGENAETFPPGDVERLAAILCRLARDGERRTALSTVSARLAAENDAPAAARMLSEGVLRLLQLGPRSTGSKRVAA